MRRDTRRESRSSNKLKPSRLLAWFLLSFSPVGKFHLNFPYLANQAAIAGRRSRLAMVDLPPPELLLKSFATSILAIDAIKRLQPCVPEWVLGCEAEDIASTIRKLHGNAAYWPTPWLAGLLCGHIQTIWYGLNPSPPVFDFEEDVWITSDNGTLGLAWPRTPDSLSSTAPIVLILPGLCGSIKNAGHAIRAMIAAGLRPVVLHARGCGQPLTSPRFNLFGFTDDLREAVQRVSMKHENSPVCLYSISAGTALMVRYLGEEGPRAPIAAAVANCPGYDIGVCLQRVNALYDKGFYVNVLKRHWLSGRNGEVLRSSSPELYSLMEQAPDMHSFMVAASPFTLPELFLDGKWDSGIVANAFPQFLSKSNPMSVAHRMRVPGLIINADDDPVCARTNTDENGAALLSGSSCRKTVLLRYPSGGHCCFAYGMRAQRWVDQLAADFLFGIIKSGS